MQSGPSSEPTVSISADDFSEGTKTASQLYAQSLLMDMLKQMGSRKSKHNKARALRAQARQAKRKAKRKANRK